MFNETTYQRACAKQSFKQAVYLLRRKANLSLREVAALAGVSIGRISQIQTEIESTPSDEVLRGLTNALKSISVTPFCNMSPLETEVARLMVQTLNLGMDPAHISPDDPLFREGLGLDSIDALELSLAVSRCYGYHLRSDDPDITATFSSLRALCKSIEKHRTK